MSLDVNLVLLPGLDGTARLFDPFVRAAPPGLSILPVALPSDRVLSYDQLADFALAALKPGRTVLLGESFSGPLALRLAGRTHPAATILCASFIRAPAPARLSAAPLSILLRSKPPVSVIRALLSGGDEVLAADLVHAISTIDPHVIASRIRMVLQVDAISDLSAFPGRLLYLRPTQDRVVGSRQAALVRKVRPDAEVAEIAGPHLLLQTRPKECWGRIMSFLAPLTLS